ncbi:uncharacterized protein [Dermacentor andersoni]|uniref:uncharacterized protein n=1 Tax=Dermacentor andersoni TaxID=34620 RepID=UPI003B3AC6FC
MKVEALFQLRCITYPTARYLHFVAPLPSVIADAIDDLLARTPSATAYDDLKGAVLQRLEPSQQRRIQKLLSEDLGDQRQSQLLHWLRQLLGGHPKNESQLPILRELLLQRLTQSVSMVLTGSVKTSLHRLRALADRICDSSVCVTATYHRCESLKAMRPTLAPGEKSRPPCQCTGEAEDVWQG